MGGVLSLMGTGGHPGVSAYLWTLELVQRAQLSELQTLHGASHPLRDPLDLNGVVRGDRCTRQLLGCQLSRHGGWEHVTMVPTLQIPVSWKVGEARAPGELGVSGSLDTASLLDMSSSLPGAGQRLWAQISPKTPLGTWIQSRTFSLHPCVPWDRGVLGSAALGFCFLDTVSWLSLLWAGLPGKLNDRQSWVRPQLVSTEASSQGGIQGKGNSIGGMKDRLQGWPTWLATQPSRWRQAQRLQAETVMVCV